MMWNSLLLLYRDLVRDDRQTVVHLHRVAIDNLAIESFGQVNGKLWNCQIELKVERELVTCDFPVPVAPRTTSKGSFGGFFAMVTYFRALLTYLSIRAMDLFVFENRVFCETVSGARGAGKASS